MSMVGPIRHEPFRRRPPRRGPRAARFLALALIAGLVALLPAAPVAAAPAGATPGQSRAAAPVEARGDGHTIVVLRRTDRAGSVAVARTAAALATQHGFTVGHVYDHALHGFAATLDAGQLAALRRDPRVAFARPDRRMTLTSQLEPPGVKRVGAHVSPLAKIDEVDGPGDRIDADIAILDTGVDAEHSDLDVVGGVDCTVHPGTDSTPVGHPLWGDIQGHGTHVAGTAAAIDNGFGVVGVAPGARIWSVRIFRPRAHGWESNLLCGIDWVTAQRDPARTRSIEVANMSMRIGHDDDGVRSAMTATAATRTSTPSTRPSAPRSRPGTSSPWPPATNATMHPSTSPPPYDEVITVSAMADFDGLPGGLAPTPATATRIRAASRTSTTRSPTSAPTVPTSTSSPPASACARRSGPPATSRTATARCRAPPWRPPRSPAAWRCTASRTRPQRPPRCVPASPPRGTATGRPRPTRTASPTACSTSRAPARPRTSASSPAPRVRGVQAGVTRSYTVEVSRGFAFLDPITLTLDAGALPAGVTAELARTDLTDLEDVDIPLTVTVPPATPDSGPLGIAVGASGGAGPIEHSVIATLIIDSTAPDLAPPTVRFRRGAAAGTTNVPLYVQWTGSDASGTHRFELARHADAGPWVPVPLAQPTTSAVTSLVPPVHEYRFRVRAVDLAGNETLRYGPTLLLRRRSEDSGTIAFSTGWLKQTAEGAYGGSVRWSTKAGATATFSFIGRAFGWFSPTSPQRGAAEVYVDDVLVETVSLASDDRLTSRVVFAMEWPGTPVRHTVRYPRRGHAGTPAHRLRRGVLPPLRQRTGRRRRANGHGSRGVGMGARRQRSGIVSLDGRCPALHQGTVPCSDRSPFCSPRSSWRGSHRPRHARRKGRRSSAGSSPSGTARTSSPSSRRPSGGWASRPGTFTNASPAASRRPSRRARSASCSAIRGSPRSVPIAPSS